MDTQTKYTIPLRNLEVGRHQFEFELDDRFFQAVNGSEIQHGEISVDADVERNNNMMTVNFYFEGEVEVVCDRCLDLFYIPIESENTLSVWFSNLLSNSDEEYYAEEEGEEDILFADPSDDELDITHYLYESVCLSLPIQRVHSDDENGKSLCDEDVIKYLKQHEVSNGGEEDENDDE